MKQSLIIILSLLCLNCSSQSPEKFNLDFETYDNSMTLPNGWKQWGEYQLTVDSTSTHSGNYAIKITSQENAADQFGSAYYTIPARYIGDSILLEGYMKYKNVTDGFVGLLLRLDGQNATILFDNMEKLQLSGSSDWRKYSIALKFPKETENIRVGGILVGNGEAWFDDFKITIDGKDIQILDEVEKPVAKATLDNEFDVNSNIRITTITDAGIKNLELLGRIWGFLKYHHPEITGGNYNWDFELFRVLPQYLEIKTTADRNRVLMEWISKYGVVKPCTSCQKTNADAVLKPDIRWMEQFEMNPELINKLKFIYDNRNQGSQYYIQNTQVGNPIFSNETKYYSMQSDDDGVKLLALYRFWNMVQYFSPNKHLTDNNWNSILKEYIPKFINSKNKLEYELACAALIAEHNDTHSTTNIGFTALKNSRGAYYPPFKTKFIDSKLVVTDYYNPELKQVSKIEVGDVITHINGKPIKVIIDSITPYYPASNQAALLRNIASDVLRSNQKQIKIDYLSNNSQTTHSLPLYNLEDLNTRWYDFTNEKSYKMLEGNIGYVTLKTITEDDISKIKDLFINTKGIIIDIRNYPSTFVPFKLGGYFVSTSSPFVKFTGLNINNPGEFNYREGANIPAQDTTYKGKLVVLVNEETQSQAEYTSMAFRAGDNTTIVGSTTAGADGNISSIYLPGGLLTHISGIGVYYPDGTETQRVGIVPDVEVHQTIEGIKQGRDELMEKAIKIIND